MRMNSYIRHPSVAVPYSFMSQYVRPVFVVSDVTTKKQKTNDAAASARCYSHRLFAFSLLLGVVAEAKLKPTTPSSAGIIPFRYVANCYFTLRMPVLHHPVQTFVSRIKPLFLSRRILFYGSNPCIV
jgi:hypothetical protein